MTLPKMPDPELTANVGTDGEGFPITGPAYSKRNMLAYGKAVYQSVTESPRSPGCSAADMVDLGDLALEHVVRWADGVSAALGTDDLANRVTEVEAEVAAAILKIAHARNYSW